MTQQLEKRLIDSLDSIKAKGSYDLAEILTEVLRNATVLELYTALKAVSKELGIDIDAASAGPQSSDEAAPPAEERRYSIKVVKPTDPEKEKALAENKIKLLKLLGELDTAKTGSLTSRLKSVNDLELRPIILAQGLTKEEMEAKKQEFFAKVPIEFVVE